ncbi:uncharacterized protein PAC_05465 [Phialocephala subalpina]|uniref:Uncharacterized protein n=1 Tax=Phialocephala subalpina TaxID=576137 RepID=A0A1L7WS28_9HELO|nr:uncharacterized protein PAC_05465 [Phialocephala subalpina]
MATTNTTQTTNSHFSLSSSLGSTSEEEGDIGLPIFLQPYRYTEPITSEPGPEVDVLEGLELNENRPDSELYLPPSVFRAEDSSSRGGSGTTTPRNEIPQEHRHTFGDPEPADRMGADTMKEVQVPTHPIPSMQAAFAESMLEANDVTTPPVPKNRPGNAAARRKLLLDQDVSEGTHAGKWKQRPGQRYHELWKLIAQISFGVYLLMNGIAKDDDQVMSILQGHVDEVDEFLETTLEDFDLAQEDIEERLKFLKLPLENIIIFDAMLEDRQFRLQIVSGNERIEHVITRTATAMNDALKDVQQGLDACKEFTIYLAEEEKNEVWMRDRPDMQKVFDAMKGNVEGWYKAYVSLQTKGNHLGVALVQLGSIVAEMDRRAGEISRKSRFSTQPATTQMASPPSSPPQSKEMRRSMSKNLPSDPNLITPAIRATLPAFQLVTDRERTPSNASETSSEVEAPEPDFILKPRTYSPAPSPIPPSAPMPVQEPPPELTKRSSLRERFSLKRKETPSDITLKVNVDNIPDEEYWGPRHRVVSSSQRERPREVSIHNDRPRKNSNTHSHRETRPRDSSLNTPPSRGLDSAYCSDFEKNSSPSAAPPPSIPLRQTHSHTSQYSTSRPFHQHPIPSPLSDQQFFRPVQASPNSPSNDHGQPAPPIPSTCTATPQPPTSLNATTTTPIPPRNSVIDAALHQQWVKKKRSAFGWLKKAFSLSEEEKAAFEQRRVQSEAEREDWKRMRGEVARGWRDGKRVR